MLKFKLWFTESEEEYNRLYRDKMQQAWSEQPRAFQHWFPEGENTIYIPITIDDNIGDITYEGKNIGKRSTREVRERAEAILNRYGYRLIDFRKGFAGKFNDKRPYKILFVLKEIHEQLKQKTGSVARDYVFYVDQIMTDIIEAHIRLNEKGNQFLMAISQDPHHIAKMSYDRKWEMASCMRLPDSKKPPGEKSKEVIDEVREGGLISYLINPDDKQIRNPLTRILIRRFTDRNGTSIAVCEDREYGVMIPQYRDELAKWITQKQGGTPFGSMKRKGSEWSDTFQNPHEFRIRESDIKPGNEAIVLKALQSYAQKDTTTIFFRTMKDVLTTDSTNNKLNDNFWKEAIDLTNTVMGWDHYANDPTIHKAEGYFYYMLPRKAYDLKMPVENIKNILMAFPIGTLLHTPLTIMNFAKHDEGIVDWMYPVLKEMLHASNYRVSGRSVAKLAEAMHKFPVLTSDDFLKAMPKAALEEIFSMINDDKLKEKVGDLVVQNKIEILKKWVNSYEVADNEEDSESSVDSITELIHDIENILSSNRKGVAYQIAKKHLPNYLYDRLFGHQHV